MSYTSNLKYAFLTVLLALAPSFCFAADKLKVGVIIPLSGPLAEYGNNIKLGLDLAKSKLESAGSAHIELAYEDDQFDSSKAVSAFQKLSAGSEPPRAILTFGFTIGNTLAPLAEKKAIVLIAIGASDKSVSRGKKYVFTHWVSPETEAAAMVKEVIKRRYESIAIVRTENDGLNAISDSFVAALRSAGLESSMHEQISVLPDLLDFKSLILKLKQKKITAIATLLFPKQLPVFAKQLRELGLKVAIFGADSFEDNDALQAADGALENAWYAIGDSGTKVFQSLFENFYGYHVKAISANAFDSLNLVVSAWQAQSKSSLAMADFLRSVKNYRGACGAYSASGENSFELPAVIKIVTKDGFEVLGDKHRR